MEHQLAQVIAQGSVEIGDTCKKYGLPKACRGRCSVKFCNTVSHGGSYCKHCRMPAAKATTKQWQTLMLVVEEALKIGALPSEKIIDGDAYELDVLAFIVLDYGFLVAPPNLKKSGSPGIPLHQDTSCLGQAIGSFLVDGDDKTVDVLYDNVQLNGAASGRCVSFKHERGSFYAMTENTRWLARHRIRHVDGQKRSLGLLVRLNWKSRKAREQAEILRIARENAPSDNADEGRELWKQLKSIAPWYQIEDFKYDEQTWDIDGLVMAIEESMNRKKAGNNKGQRSNVNQK